MENNNKKCYRFFHLITKHIMNILKKYKSFYSYKQFSLKK